MSEEGKGSKGCPTLTHQEVLAEAKAARLEETARIKQRTK